MRLDRTYELGYRRFSTAMIGFGCLFLGVTAFFMGQSAGEVIWTRRPGGRYASLE